MPFGVPLRLLCGSPSPNVWLVALGVTPLRALFTPLRGIPIRVSRVHSVTLGDRVLSWFWCDGSPPLSTTSEGSNRCESRRSSHTPAAATGSVRQTPRDSSARKRAHSAARHLPFVLPPKRSRAVDPPDPARTPVSDRPPAMEVDKAMEVDEGSLGATSDALGLSSPLLEMSLPTLLRRMKTLHQAHECAFP